MYIITGGGTGIGRSLAHALARRDCEVLIVGRGEQALQEAASYSKKIHWISADVSSAEGRQILTRHCAAYHKVTALIHNAGTIEPIVPINELQLNDLRQAFATNFEAPLCLTQALAQSLTGGKVLSIGSGAAYFPVKGWTAYCSSKAALAMQIRCWQMELKDIAFASVMPGIVDTNMQAFIRNAEQMDEQKLAFFKQLKHDNQLLSADTVALFLAWLLLDLSGDEFASKEWDIYDKTHHSAWLTEPHKVPQWQE